MAAPCFSRAMVRIQELMLWGCLPGFRPHTRCSTCSELTEWMLCWKELVEMPRSCLGRGGLAVRRAEPTRTHSTHKVFCGGDCPFSAPPSCYFTCYVIRNFRAGSAFLEQCRNSICDFHKAKMSKNSVESVLPCISGAGPSPVCQRSGLR